jgi:hypothetical protein
MTIFFAQALAEYGGMAAVAESVTHLSLRLGDAIGEWRVEALVAVVVVAFLWRVLTAVR